MTVRLLALLLSLTLVLPAGWASAAMWICKGEGVVHALAAHEVAVPDCCREGCAHPDHQRTQAVDDTCCTELDDGDDRQAGPERPELAPMVAVLPAGPPWPAPPRLVQQRVSLWEVGPPSTGPPPWLLHRVLLR